MAEPRRQPAAGRRRRRTRAGTDLSREVYIDAAVNLIENRGAAVMSARTLAAAVGADASALYRYFGSVDDVLRAVADRMIGIALDNWSRSSTGSTRWPTWRGRSTACTSTTSHRPASRWRRERQVWTTRFVPSS